jgi:hypothetical protein
LYSGKAEPIVESSIRRTSQEEWKQRILKANGWFGFATRDATSDATILTIQVIPPE